MAFMDYIFCDYFSRRVYFVTWDWGCIMGVRKKGEVSISFLTKFILFVMGFVAVLVLFSLLVWGVFSASSTEKKICEFSVVLRGTLPLTLGTVFPLRCTTEKICLSGSGSDCSGFEWDRSTQDVTLEKIRGDDAAQKEVILQILSDALYDCHTTYGEGKIDFQPYTVSKEKACLICSRVKVDETLLGSVEDISYIELYQFMQSHEVGRKSYLQAVYGTESVNDMTKVLQGVVDSANARDDVSGVSTIEDLMIDMGAEQAIIIQYLTDDLYGRVLKGGAAGTLVGSVLTVGGIALSPFTFGSSIAISAVGIATVAGGSIGGIIYGTQTPNGNGYTYPSLYVYDVQSLRSLECVDPLTL
jgi:hypothetical protein